MTHGGIPIAATAVLVLLLAGCATPDETRRDAEVGAAVEKAQAAEARCGALEERVAALEAALKAKGDNENTNANLADLLKGATPPAPPPPGPPKVGPNPTISAIVLAADPAVDIHLISAGEKDGLRVGDELTVFRGDQFVAVVLVDKVFADKASVVVKKVDGKPFKNGEIKQGDKVVTAL